MIEWFLVSPLGTVGLETALADKYVFIWQDAKL
jgi:hypothetical protein